MLSSSFQEALDRAKNPYYDLVTLPDWFDGFRPNQVDAIDEVIKAFAEVDLVVLDAPTGSGKTLIADVVRQLLNVPALYMCTTKTLQDQVARDFPYAALLKGRGNYPTINYPERFNHSWDGLSTADCTKTPGVDDSCQWCPSVRECKYEEAKRDGLRSPFTIVNTSYFLTECNGPGRFSGRGLVIADEGDVVEKELMGYVEVTISESRIKKYKLRVPKLTVEEDWKQWVEEAKPIINQQYKLESQRLAGNQQDIRLIREVKYLASLSQKIEWLREGLADGSWIFTGERDKVSFKPVTVEGLGEKFLWQHGKRWLVMSGTVISSQEMLESLGWTKSYRTVRLPSTFPLENRRVIVRPVADLKGKVREEDEERKLVDSVANIISTRPESILIHTHSYSLGKVIQSGLQEQFGGRRTILSYASSAERESIISKFRGEKGAVIIGASLDRGVDLPGDMCRVQIICKVPWLSLGDKQVSKRLYGTGRKGQVWYSCQAVRSLIQMTGRAVRGPDDWAVCYVLDKGFGKLFAENRGMFPKWFVEGLVWERV